MTQTPDTKRRILHTDEDGERLFIEPIDAPYRTNLDDHGIQIPVELIALYEEQVKAWDAMQKRLMEWFSSVRPDDEAKARHFESVVLEHGRTWGQYAALPHCDHEEAIKALEVKDAAGGIGGASCEICGTYLNYTRRRYNRDTGQWEDLEPPYEINVGL